MKSTRMTKRFPCVVLSIILTISTFVGLNLNPKAIDSRVEKAVQIAVGIANDNSHGYSQTSRRGPDYDCASLVYYLWSCSVMFTPNSFLYSTLT